MTLVERLQKECDRHTIGYPGPRREVAETLQLAADEIERLEKALETAREALEPLSDAVFNDNGDMTVQRPLPTAEECIKAYFVERRIRALSQKKEG